MVKKAVDIQALNGFLTPRFSLASASARWPFKTDAHKSGCLAGGDGALPSGTTTWWGGWVGHRCRRRAGWSRAEDRATVTDGSFSACAGSWRPPQGGKKQGCERGRRAE